MISRGLKPDGYPSKAMRLRKGGCAGMGMRQLGRVISPSSKISAAGKAKDGHLPRVCAVLPKKALLHRFGFGSVADCRCCVVPIPMV